MMSGTKVFMCVLIVAGVKCEQSTTQKYVAYNSSDLSYLSNGIQFPVPPNVEEDSKVERARDESAPIMKWLSELYDHHSWNGKLQKIEDGTCRKDLSTYLEELKNGTSWAAKMHDASGRYNSHFFYGNDFWLGSQSLCEELTNKETNVVVPPFPVRFFVAKVRININEVYTPVTRQILIGQCLPGSCDSGDLKSVFLQERSQARSLVVVDVRPVPGTYSTFTDRKFYIVGGTAATVTALIVIATITEVFLKVRSKNQDEEVQNNNNNGDVKEKEKKESPKRGKSVQLLLSFSALSNGSKILSLDKATLDSIRCIHGLRVFSIAWIVMVHTYLEVFSIAENKTMRTVTERSFLYQTVSNGTFSVDTFFFISGLLVTIVYFRSEAKKPPRQEEKLLPAVSKSSQKLFLLLLYRYLRLTPAYLFVIGVNELMLRFTHNSSVYSPAIIDHITCDLYWWRNALYINNFFPQHEFCMLWSWYIANDTQFYVLASILLIIAVRGQKHVRWVGAAILTFTLTSWLTTFVIAVRHNYIARVEEPFALFDLLYDKPWLRCGPYFVGMVTGYFLFKNEAPRRIPKWVVAITWPVVLACLVALVYGFGRTGLMPPLSAVHAALGHTTWGICLAWITVACCWGYGGPVDSILSFRGFLPLSRLTYCTYLIHPVLMVYTSFQMDGPIHLHQLNVLIIFLGNTVVSFMVAFLISLAFEAPVVRLLKIILAPRSKDE